jgi:TonB family protein
MLKLTEDWGRKISAYFEQHKRFPEGKKRSAKVKVALVLNRLGKVVSVAVQESSGDPSFDDAAVSMIHRSDPVPAPPSGLTDDQFSFSLDVEIADADGGGIIATSREADLVRQAAASASDRITKRHHASRRISAFLDQMIVVAADDANPAGAGGAHDKSDMVRPHCDDARRRPGRRSAILRERTGCCRAGAAESGAGQNHVGKNRAPGDLEPGRIGPAIALGSRQHP